MASSSRVTRSASQATSPANGATPNRADAVILPAATKSMSTKAKKTARSATKKPQAPASVTSEQVPARLAKRHARTASNEDEAMPPPATPSTKRQRRGVESSSAPPTPTPALAKDFAAATAAGPTSSLPSSRPADPEATNAPLSTPRGTRYVAYPLGDSPAPQYLPAPRATTANLLDKACAHLCAVDPRMHQLIDAHPCPLFTPASLATPVDPFEALVRGILAQQVSGAAAASIKRKFVGLFQDGDDAEDTEVGEAPADSGKKPAFFPQPAQVVTRDVATLRTAGLSQRKAEYVLGLAQKFVDGELSAAILAQASWEEVLEKLTAVRGLGVWSVEMFGCFALKRMDVFSTGDLGVQRGLAAFVGRDVKKLKAKGGKWKYMTEKEMLENSAKFAPYRSLFMWYMWRVEDVNLDAIQGS